MASAPACRCDLLKAGFLELLRNDAFRRAMLQYVHLRRLPSRPGKWMLRAMMMNAAASALAATPKLKKSFAKVKALLYFQKTYCTLVTLEIP